MSGMGARLEARWWSLNQKLHHLLSIQLDADIEKQDYAGLLPSVS